MPSFELPMKPNRTYFFIGLSSVALALVLGIQVFWILESARMKEELFNEKANMVLSRTTEALGSDQETCRKIDDCLASEEDPGSEANLGREEVVKIDSIFNHYMRLYNFRIAYTFVVSKPNAPEAKSRLSGNMYNRPLENGVKSRGVQLKLIFPEKKQYILAELGIPFFSSVALILVVLVLFWKTVRSLLKEKEISEHTTDFLNNMTHEFKTPLTNISLAGKMMTRESNLGKEEMVRHYSGIILSENEKLRLQVEQVLSMTALERGEIPVQKTVLDLHQLIRDAVESFRLQVEGRSGEIQTDLKARSFIVNGDKTHLTNVLRNLLDNAVKYSPEKPELRIETSDDEEVLCIRFSDKGMGIEPDYQKKVFEKFFRVPTGNLHDVKGFGLGLAYVKKIVELHCGTIALESEKGVGTTFTITLPLADGKA